MAVGQVLKEGSALNRPTSTPLHQHVALTSDQRKSHLPRGSLAYVVAKLFGQALPKRADTAALQKCHRLDATQWIHSLCCRLRSLSILAVPGLVQSLLDHGDAQSAQRTACRGL